MNHIWQKEKRYFISIQHINSNRQDSIFHKGEKSYWESMDCSSEVNYAEPQCALNVVWAVAWRSSLRTSSPCTEGEERWKLLVCLDKQSVWKVKLPFKMLKLTRKSRQTGFACLFKKWEKTRYHYWHFKGAEKCFEEFNNKSVVSVMSFFTFWKGKTANFFFMSLILLVTTKTKKDPNLKEMWKHGITKKIWCTLSRSVLFLKICAILYYSTFQQDISIQLNFILLYLLIENSQKAVGGIP